MIWSLREVLADHIDGAGACAGTIFCGYLMCGVMLLPSRKLPPEAAIPEGQRSRFVASADVQSLVA